MSSSLGTKDLRGKELTGLLDIPLVPFSIMVQAHALGMTFLTFTFGNYVNTNQVLISIMKCIISSTPNQIHV